jgi:hypothetical protein
MSQVPIDLNSSIVKNVTSAHMTLFFLTHHLMALPDDV